MQPPVSFLISSEKQFSLKIPYRDKFDIKSGVTLLDLPKYKLPPLSCYISFDGLTDILYESVLLQALDTKEAFEKATKPGFECRMLLHVKITAVGHDAASFSWKLMCKDRNGRPIALDLKEQTIIEMGLRHADVDMFSNDFKNNCMVMEWSLNKGIIGFICNTTQNQKLKKPSWV